MPNRLGETGSVDAPSFPRGAGRKGDAALVNLPQTGESSLLRSYFPTPPRHICDLWRHAAAFFLPGPNRASWDAATSLILCLALAADSLHILEFFLFRDRISRHILSLIRNKEQVSYFFKFKLPVIAWFLQHSLGVEREGAITVIKSGICFHGRQRKCSCEMFDFLF